VAVIFVMPGRAEGANPKSRRPTNVKYPDTNRSNPDFLFRLSLLSRRAAIF
jgi:hypothetical protein